MNPTKFNSNKELNTTPVYSSRMLQLCPNSKQLSVGYYTYSCNSKCKCIQFLLSGTKFLFINYDEAIKYIQEYDLFEKYLVIGHLLI